MRVLHIISCLVKADGHSQFCMRLAERLSGQGLTQMVFTLPSPRGEALPDLKRLVQHAHGRLHRFLNVSLPLGIGRQIAALALPFKPDVIHLHGGWHPFLFFGAKAARKMRVPILVSLHGSLRPTVVEGDRRLRKKLAWRLYQRRLVEMADMVHVSTESEKEDLARLGFDKPVVVVPNGVDVDAFFRPGAETLSALKPLNPCASRDGAQEPLNLGTSVQRDGAVGPLRLRTVLYLGRLHPLKGLDLLISAWAQVKKRSLVERPETGGQRTEDGKAVSSIIPHPSSFSDWQLVIAGPDEQGTLKALKEQVKRLGLEGSVTFTGPLYGEEKAEVMAAADLFVLPTRSDNFGIAVAEALASGTPVISTTGAPWQELERYLCGWWVDVGVEPLAAALVNAMALSDDERREMGARGRRWVETEFRWESVAVRMEEVYQRLSRGPIEER